MKRRRAREAALQMLFQSEFTGGGQPDFEAFWKDKGEDEDVVRFANSLVRGTLDNLAEVDSAIKGAAENWVIERMAAVDRNILRSSTYELLFLHDVPHAVAINEALEVAKKFSTAESAAFINGILDRIAQKRGKPAAR